MKTKQLMAMAVGLALCGGVVLGQGEYAYTFTNGVNSGGGGGWVIPDGNPNGIATVTNLAGISGAIGNVSVSLDLSGGFNGDLYAYLVGPNGGFAVLLNRVGVTNGNAYGYSDSGMNVTFSDSASVSIHDYQNVGGYSLSGTTWQPDGEAIDPQSSPSLFTGAQSAMLSSFENNSADGNWTLFLADLSAGGQSTLVSWSLDITTVPEPSVLALTGLGLAGIGLLIRRRKNAL